MKISKKLLLNLKLKGKYLSFSTSNLPTYSPLRNLSLTPKLQDVIKIKLIIEIIYFITILF